jgi:hypothetical protein
LSVTDSKTGGTWYCKEGYSSSRGSGRAYQPSNV